MPRALSFAVVDDDDTSSCCSEEYYPQENVSRSRAYSKRRSTCHGPTAFPGVNSTTLQNQEDREGRERQEQLRFLVLSGQVTIEEPCAANNHRRVFKRNKESGEFGIGTRGEADQERAKALEQVKEPRYGRKEKEIVQPLKRKESVYDRLRRSDSVSSMKSLTNQKVATRSNSRRQPDPFEGVPEVSTPTSVRLPPIHGTSSTGRDNFYHSIQYNNNNNNNNNVSMSSQSSTSNNNNNNKDGAAVVLMAPPREQKGGVVDQFGYFSTHRVNPDYYSELRRQSRHASYYENTNNINNNNSTRRRRQSGRGPLLNTVEEKGEEGRQSFRYPSTQRKSLVSVTGS